MPPTNELIELIKAGKADEVLMRLENVVKNPEHAHFLTDFNKLKDLWNVYNRGIVLKMYSPQEVVNKQVKELQQFLNKAKINVQTSAKNTEVDTRVVKIRRDLFDSKIKMQKETRTHSPLIILVIAIFNFVIILQNLLWGTLGGFMLMGLSSKKTPIDVILFILMILIPFIILIIIYVYFWRMRKWALYLVMVINLFTVIQFVLQMIIFPDFRMIFFVPFVLLDKITGIFTISVCIYHWKKFK